MTEDEYRARAPAGPVRVSVRSIAAAMGVSLGRAARVRKSETVPRPQHWGRQLS
jgi:hypothetical protein